MSKKHPEPSILYLFNLNKNKQTKMAAHLRDIHILEKLEVNIGCLTNRSMIKNDKLKKILKQHREEPRSYRS